MIGSMSVSDLWSLPMFFFFLSTIVNHIPWTLVFLLLRYMRIRLYVIRNPDDCKRIQRRLNDRCTHMTEDKRGFGYSIGFWYILSIEFDRSEYGNYHEVWMVATQSSFDALMKDEKPTTTPMMENASCTETDTLLKQKDITIQKEKTDDITPNSTGKLTIVRRSGTYYNMYYRLRETMVSTPTPWQKQEIIISSIMEQYKKKRHVVAYIHGPPGSGKSTISIILGKRLKGTFYNTFTPWQPGESINMVYAEVEPSEDCPLVLAMDEIDESLVLIDKGIPPHTKIPISVNNRSGWNKMMDEINIGLYPFLIMICTSNKPPGYLDASYLRDGRVDKIFSLS